MGEPSKGEKGNSGWLLLLITRRRCVSHSTCFTVSRLFPLYFVLLARAHARIHICVLLHVLLPFASASSPSLVNANISKPPKYSVVRATRDALTQCFALSSRVASSRNFTIEEEAVADKQRHVKSTCIRTHIRIIKKKIRDSKRHETINDNREDRRNGRLIFLTTEQNEMDLKAIL